MRRVLTTLAPAAASSIILPAYKLRECGAPQTKAWRLYAQREDGGDISAWHDLPRRPRGAEADPRVITYFNEIPRGTRAKMELLKNEEGNPVAQDIHKKKPDQPLRFFSYGDAPFNYGFTPQTWENPEYIDADTQCRGDGDPIDVVYLGPTCATGTCAAARVLGILGLVDEGETDWKIITCPATGTDAVYKSISEVPAEARRTIVDWFRNYKTTEGKKPNDFAFGGEFRDADYALHILKECSGQYDALMRGQAMSHDYWLGKGARG